MVMNWFVGTAIEKDVHKQLLKLYHTRMSTKKYEFEPLCTIYGFNVIQPDNNITQVNQ